MSDARIYQIVYMTIHVAIGLSGLYFLFAPKADLLKFAESYNVIGRFGRTLGRTLAYERKDGSLTSVPPIWQIRVLGLVLAVYSLWCLITIDLHGAA